MSNPRHSDTCRKCGKPMPVHPQARRRSLEFERDVTENAARGLCDPQPLIVHAETRARLLSAEYVSDPMLVAPGRDRLRDVREEIADARNHIAWWLEEHADAENSLDVLRSLQYLLLAYEQLIP